MTDLILYQKSPGEAVGEILHLTGSPEIVKVFVAWVLSHELKNPKNGIQKAKRRELQKILEGTQ